MPYMTGIISVLFHTTSSRFKTLLISACELYSATSPGASQLFIIDDVVDIGFSSFMSTEAGLLSSFAGGVGGGGSSLLRSSLAFPFCSPLVMVVIEAVLAGTVVDVEDVDETTPLLFVDVVVYVEATAVLAFMFDVVPGVDGPPIFFALAIARTSSPASLLPSSFDMRSRKYCASRINLIDE